MVASPGDPIEADTSDLDDSTSAARPKLDWTTQLDTEQVFRLIDSILPFEACLYHQVLPLSLAGSRLKLGMVTLEDTAALDYVRRILAYMNCSLVPQQITSELHHAALTAYLNHTGKRAQRANAESAARNGSPTREPGQPPQQRPIAPTSQNIAPTFLVQHPDETPAIDNAGLLESPAAPIEADATQILALPPDVVPPSQPNPELPPDQQPLMDARSSQATLILEPEALSPAEGPPAIPVPPDALPTLEVNATHLADPVELLAALPPDRLLQELLGRILIGGIGRLYFERQAQQGRILWSQNGVLQSVLEGLPLASFQGVIDELKQLLHLPPEPLQKPRQVEIERLYQRHRLLLRLRVMPNAHGEEATLQVLRGAALRFYQQQQLATLSRDALNIAQELQRKMNELRSRTRTYPNLNPEQLSILPALDEVLKSVEQQLDMLRSLQTDSSKTEESS